ncbi:cell wall-binding repeat-containing protein, partial [Clostridioides sp. ZZV14-6048]|nr:cell wall-binding repeat-containing protein [Clostridioides sp. ZZV14-6048]
GDMKANIDITGLPAGLDYTALGSTSANTITITITGQANQAVGVDIDNVSVTVKKEAVSGTGAIDSDANSSFKIKKYVAPAVGKIAFTATDDTIKMDSDD